jgi:hypothetical protein|tara:strand:- start:516 stop:707 length:192 start_codon:yes stop_codon:yes gene_type:complete
MPEYQATIKSNIKGVHRKKIKLFASCYSDAEKMANQSLTKDEYLDSLDNINFPKDRFNTVERR